MRKSLCPLTTTVPSSRRKTRRGRLAFQAIMVFCAFVADGLFPRMPLAVVAE